MIGNTWRGIFFITSVGLGCLPTSFADRPKHDTQSLEPGGHLDPAIKDETWIPDDPSCPEKIALADVVSFANPPDAFLLTSEKAALTWVMDNNQLDEAEKNLACVRVGTKGSSNKVKAKIDHDLKEVSRWMEIFPTWMRPSTYVRKFGEMCLKSCGVIGTLASLWLGWWIYKQYIWATELMKEDERVQQAMKDTETLLAKFDNPEMREEMNEIQRKLCAAVLCQDVEGLRVTPDESIRFLSEYRDMNLSSMSEEDILRSWENDCVQPADAATRALQQLKEAAAEMKDAMNIGDWVLSRRQQLDTDASTNSRMAMLSQDFITSGNIDAAIQMDLGPHDASTPEDKYVMYSSVKAHWARPVTQGILLDILHTINAANSVMDNDLMAKMGGCHLSPDFDDVNLRLFEKDSHLYNGKRCAMKIAGVKDGKRVLPKTGLFLKNPLLSERPAARYNGDWNRAMAIAKDPVVLRVFFELLHNHPRVRVKRINNKLFSSDRNDPEDGQYCTHILILYGILVWDQIRCIEVEHVAEVQLILHDFYVVDGTQHKIYEVERTERPEDIAFVPVFPIIQMDAKAPTTSGRKYKFGCKKRKHEKTTDDFTTTQSGQKFTSSTSTGRAPISKSLR